MLILKKFAYLLSTSLAYLYREQSSLSPHQEIPRCHGMARSQRKVNSPPYEDEDLSSDSSDDSSDDQYDTDLTKPSCEDDQLQDAGDIAQLFADNEHLPEYYLQKL